MFALITYVLRQPSKYGALKSNYMQAKPKYHLDTDDPFVPNSCGST